MKRNKTFAFDSNTLFLWASDMPPIQIMERITILEKKVDNLSVKLEFVEMKELLDLYIVS